MLWDGNNLNPLLKFPLGSGSNRVVHRLSSNLKPTTIARRNEAIIPRPVIPAKSGPLVDEILKHLHDTPQSLSR